MSDYMLDIESFLKKRSTCPVIDVRSPAEYVRGHIPGAYNMPLFSNEERSVIGTLYLQKGSIEATRKGLEIAGPRMKDFADKALQLASQESLGIYCWRGGMRSKSMTWLLNVSGINTFALSGGYKAYRSFVHQYIARTYDLVVLGGMTGSGKTEILEEIEKAGYQVIHLERLASHRGSVFGHIGMPVQPSTEQFENNLFTALHKMDPTKPVFVEDESLVIGGVFIPGSFYSSISCGRFIELLVSFENRVDRLVRIYTNGNREILASGVRRIEKRLGTENTTRAIHFIESGDMKSAVQIVLPYYDKVYRRGISMHNRETIAEITINGENAVTIAGKVLKALTKI